MLRICSQPAMLAKALDLPYVLGFLFLRHPEAVYISAPRLPTPRIHPSVTPPRFFPYQPPRLPTPLTHPSATPPTGVCWGPAELYRRRRWHAIYSDYVHETARDCRLPQQRCSKPCSSGRMACVWARACGYMPVPACGCMPTCAGAGAGAGAGVTLQRRRVVARGNASG